MSEKTYLETLNEPQKEAVLTTDGPLLILAGAGAGKTKVITHRIVHLIHEGVSPHNILAVTFTNKAAKEMRERVMKLIQSYFPSERAIIDSTPTVTTFHALGVRILREFHEAVGIRKHYTIYDRNDSIKVVKSALEEAGYNPKEFEPKKILNIISRAKGNAQGVNDFRETANSFPEEVALATWEKYEQKLRGDHALDFDDLLLKTLRLLQQHPPIREQLVGRYRYIHVDEYQDTNKVQFEIVRLLSGDEQNVCVVGDIDQSIYSWRGADIKNVLQFERNFPRAKTILLEENYRSTKTIIAASNEVIKLNKQRVEKTVFTNNQDGEKINLFAAMSGSDEADYIALCAKQLIEDGESPSSIAVLYRTNFQSRVLEEAFINYDLPYQLIGTKFFERKEVKDVLSYLRLALNPGSTADLARVINTPKRGIGKLTVLKIMAGEREKLSGAVAKKVDGFYNLMMNIAKEAGSKPPSGIIKYIMKESGLESALKDEGTEESLSRLENLRELVTLAGRYDELPPEEGISALLETASLESDQDQIKNKEEKDAVRLMTVHAAKGLEFDNVFICGLEEGLFPHERLDDSGIDHEEERRLFYVALTRAAKRVWLTYAHVRTIFGSQRVNVPSSFLNDIDPGLVEIKNPSGKSEPSGYETTIFLD